GAPAEDLRALHAGDGRESRLHGAHEVVGDLVLLQDVGAEAQVGRGELRVGRLHVDHGDLGLGRQVAAHAVHLGADLGEGAGGVVVELEAGPDGGDALGAGGLDVVDAVSFGDGALDGRGDEAAHQIGAGADVGRGDGDAGVFAARILAHRQRAVGL